MRLLFLVSEDRYFFSHRFNLAKAAVKAGFTVAVATKGNQYTEQIKAAGIQVFPLMYFDRASLNPFRQILLIKELFKVYRLYKPDIAHHVAMKPVLIGSLIAAWVKTPKIINALGGLGYLFTDSPQTKISRKKQLLRAFVCWLFRFIFFRLNATLILQNKEDLKLLETYHCLNAKNTVIIRGAGVDLDAFPFKPLPPDKTPIVIVCAARLLWDKGIGELIEAAKILLEKNLSVKIDLYGALDSENPRAISRYQIEEWQTAGLITWHNHVPHLQQIYEQCHLVVLPSYREGLPKTLLEAASTGRPIVTTEAPGCTEVVEEGVNGFCVPIQDAKALSDALITLIQNPSLRTQMGIAGRTRAERYFKDSLIHEQTLALYS